jgi:hypothetical protein
MLCDTGVSQNSTTHLMTANKKTTSKVTKSPAPATKPAKTAKAKSQPVAEAAAPVQLPTISTAEIKAPVLAPDRVTAVQAPVPIAVAPTTIVAPATVAVRPVAAVASKPLVTTISARINVGFGNSLYLRGEGAGLSWQRGVQMTCVSANEWLITLPESARPVVFKFLINDVTWSTGQDYSAIPGTSTSLAPTF